jgi:hypothetical protein
MGETPKTALLLLTETLREHQRTGSAIRTKPAEAGFVLIAIPLQGIAFLSAEALTTKIFAISGTVLTFWEV